MVGENFAFPWFEMHKIAFKFASWLVVALKWLKLLRQALPKQLLQLCIFIMRDYQSSSYNIYNTNTILQRGFSKNFSNTFFNKESFSFEVFNVKIPLRFYSNKYAIYFLLSHKSILRNEYIHTNQNILHIGIQLPP